MGRGNQVKEDLSREKRIRKAIRLVRNDGMGVREAGRTVGIPFTTLQNRLSGTTARVEAHRKQQTLTHEEELVIVAWICKCDDFGVPPMIHHVEELALALLVKREPDAKSIGVNWHHRFKARHPRITKKIAVRIERQRILASNPVTINDFFH